MWFVRSYIAAFQQGVLNCGTRELAQSFGLWEGLLAVDSSCKNGLLKFYSLAFAACQTRNHFRIYSTVLPVYRPKNVKIKIYNTDI